MLKIILTDPHLMPSEALKETGAWLLRLAGCTDPVAHMPHTPPRDIDEFLRYTETETTSLAPILKRDGTLLTGGDLEAGEEVLATYDPEKETFVLSEPNTAPPIITVERDVNGLPWDARIHTRTRSKTIDGVWKLQRGIDMKKVNTVMKELMQMMTLPASVGSVPDINPEVIPAAPLPPVTPVSPPLLPIAPVSPASPPWPSAPTAAPISPVAADPTELCPADFNTFIGRVSRHIAKGKLCHADVTRICEKRSIPSLPLVATRPDLIPEIMAEIDLVAGA